jgi:hypothetical protein
MTRRTTVAFSALFFLAAAVAATAGDEVNVVILFNGPPNPDTALKHGVKIKSIHAGLQFVSGSISASGIAGLKKEDNVASVEENHIRTVGTHPPSWGVKRVRADQAWVAAGGTTGSYVDGGGATVRVKVAVLDTAAQVSHSDLVGQTVNGLNAVAEKGYGPTDVHGHSTHVTGIVVALNDGIDVAGGPVTGVAHGAVVVNVKVGTDTGGVYSDDSAEGMDWARNNGCKVINMSYGGKFGSTVESIAVGNAWGAGVVLCAQELPGGVHECPCNRRLGYHQALRPPRGFGRPRFLQQFRILDPRLRPGRPDLVHHQ